MHQFPFGLHVEKTLTHAIQMKLRLYRQVNIVFAYVHVCVQNFNLAFGCQMKSNVRHRHGKTHSHKNRLSQAEQPLNIRVSTARAQSLYNMSVSFQKTMCKSVLLVFKAWHQPKLLADSQCIWNHVCDDRTVSTEVSKCIVLEGTVSWFWCFPLEFISTAIKNPNNAERSITKCMSPKGYDE